MKKIILVYNPQASNIASVEEEVLAEVRGLRGYLVGKYKVQKEGFAENVTEIVRMVDDGDLIVAAGGDGTASLALNAAMRSKKDITFAALGYGNFNDMARMLGMGRLLEIVERFESGKVETVNPLEVIVDGELWRYALCYTSVGMLAEATTIMNEAKVRRKLDSEGRRPVVFSWWEAVKWYLKNHRRQFLMEGKMNGRGFDKKVTDYIAVNGPTLARVMYGTDHWRDQKKFGSTLQRLGKFWRMVKFGLASINRKKGVPLMETEGDVIEWEEATTVGVQVEGEYEKLEKVEKIEIKKSSRGLKVVANIE